ncbi:MAG TPA: hypothetical protein EYO33_05105 [Phycisphaerales bacterium]|nr:hypothetical protein [Phycisphaerales bacterium]
MKTDLTETVHHLLGPSTSYSQKMALLDRADEELMAQQADYRELYKHLPQEGRELEDAFHHYTRLLDNFRELLSTQDAPEERVQELLEALKHLKGLQFDFKEKLWASRGPSTHPGLNELLVFLKGKDEDALYAHIKSEGKRVEAQDRILSSQPEFVRETLTSLIDEYYDLLQDIVESMEEGALSEERDDFLERLKLWGDEYSCHDINGLRLKYDSHPTAIPDVNFCLNMRRLYLEEFVSGHLFDHSFESARAELRQVMDWVETDERVSLGDKSQYKKLHQIILERLEDVARAKSLEDLKEVGQACVGVCDEANGWQIRFSKLR